MTGYESKKKAAMDKLVMTPEQKKIYEDGFLAGQEQLIKSSVHRAVHGLAQPTQPHCQCSACKDGKLHLSDCAVHNEPAYPAGPCDCGVLNQQIAQPAQETVARVLQIIKELRPAIKPLEVMGKGKTTDEWFDILVKEIEQAFKEKNT